MIAESQNPPMRAAGMSALDACEGTWWIGHTKSRSEKAFAWDLDRAGVGYFLPMLRKLTLSGGKKRYALVPLFPGYVFFCGTGDARYAALTTGRLAQVIPVSRQRELVGELVAIERAIEAGGLLTPHPFAAVGARCRVTAGPFVGMEGIVARSDGTTRLVLEVSILGQGASLEIDADLLEPA